MLTCPNCGRENPEGFQFCGYCRAELQPGRAAHRETRKTVTVVFTDVTGSTNLGERLDPESMRRVMGRYFEAMKAVLERHGGTVEKFIGDAVMAVFGVPSVHEDDALRAVRAAVDMGEALEDLNKELERDLGVRIETRTGVNTGQVVAGDSSTGQTMVTGDAVNVAARLQQAAQPGEVLIGASSYRLVRDAVTVGATRAIEAKGKTEPVQALPLIEVLDVAEGFQRRLDSPMIGRDRELRLLSEAFDRAVSEGTCYLFTVLGSAGVGKSRLVDEALRAIGDGAAILRGRCLPYGEGITFWPVLSVVREAAGIGEDDLPDDVRTKIAATIEGEESKEQIVDRIAQIVGVDQEGAPSEEIFWGVRKLFEGLARHRPLVVVFDDVQWGEPTFLDLIDHLADWSRDAPILLLCVARPDLFDRRPTWGGGKVNATSILLEPLTDDQAVLLVENLLGQTQLAEAVRRKVMESAEGNPLFVEQMVSMLIDDGLLRRDDGHWEPVGDLTQKSVPPTIEALLAARLDRLADEERAVIERASVVGKTFYRGAIAELAPPALRPQVGTHLMALVRKELIRPDRSDFAGEEAFKFRHILIRDAAYEAMPKEARAQLHEGFAGWLERTTGARAKEYEEIIGFHLEQAYRYRTQLGPVGEADRELADRALTHLVAAARRASGRGDVRAGISLLSRAVELLEPGDPRRIRLIGDVGSELGESGEWERARIALEETIQLARQAGDVEAEWRARVAMGSIRVNTETKRVTTEDTRREALEAIRVLEDARDDSGLAKAWYLLAEVENIEGKQGASIEALERALECARRSGDTKMAAKAAGYLGSRMFFGPTRPEEGIRRCEAFRDEFQGNRDLEAAMLRCIGRLEALQGRYDDARRRIAESLAILEDLGLGFTIALTKGFASALVEQLAGDLDAAERDLREAIVFLTRMGEKGSASSLAAVLAAVLYDRGAYDEAEPWTRTSEEWASQDDLASQMAWRSIRGKILARLGDLESGERLGREAVDIADRTDFGWRGDEYKDLAEVLGIAGRRDEALAALQRALELYEGKGNVPDAERTRVRIAELRGNG